MKDIWCYYDLFYTFCLLCIITLSGCDIKHKSTMINTYGISNISKDDIVLITSSTELDTYFNDSRFINVDNSFKDQIITYNEDFFKNNYLIIINIEDSSSIKFKLKSIIKENNVVNVTIKRTNPPITNDDLVQRSFFIEIEKDNTINDVIFEIVK